MPEIEFLDYKLLTKFGWQWDDPRLFDKAAQQNLHPEKHGSFSCDWNEYILEAAEEKGYDWPYSCRAGACTDCTAILVEGEVEMDMQSKRTREEIEELNIRLTCTSSPLTENIKILINARLLPTLQNRVIGNYDDSLEETDNGVGDLFGGEDEPQETDTKVYTGSSETGVYEPSNEDTEDKKANTTSSIPTNYCPDCGQDLSALENPQFCPNCGFEMY